MIEYKTGDIFEENTDAVVNTVNCVGVMGRGIALQFKNTYPENFEAYVAACNRGEVKPGQMFVFKTGQIINPRYIINFPTKRHWKGKSRMDDIESGLTALIETIREHNIRSVAIPPLGSGLGGLNWIQVRTKIESALQTITNVRVIVYEPNEKPSRETMKHIQDVPAMTRGRAALIGLIDRYLSGLLDPFVTLLEAHKLMYFLQEAGEPLQLKFEKAYYGPYAGNLRHVFNAIEGHFISGYADGGDAPDKQIELVPKATEDAAAFLQQHPNTQVRFDRVSNLVEGFESSFGLELLATVHWVVKHESISSITDVVRHVHAWGDRKRKMFSPRQIGIAVNTLSDKGWINAFTGKETP